MKRNKYINTFNTTIDFDNYINSAEPGFPNVALTEDDGHVHYTPTSPNSHAIFGELVYGATDMPQFILLTNNTVTYVTATADGLGNFYIDGDYGLIDRSTPIVSSNEASIKSIKKMKLTYIPSKTDYSSLLKSFTNCEYIDASGIDMSSATSINMIFNDNKKLKVLNLSGWDLSNVTSSSNAFGFYNTAMTDVYITELSTLNLLTNNLTGIDGPYIPRSATIHYNDVDYKWQNNAWTPQS